jgi:predicted peptidase
MSVNRTSGTSGIVGNVLTVAALTLLSATAAAQRGGGAGGGAMDSRAEARTYSFAETTEDMSYCVFASSKIDADTPAPLIVTLHGLGAGPEFMCNTTAIDLAEEGGYILVAPMGYNTSGWYGVPAEYRRNVGRGGGDGGDPEAIGALSEKDVMNVLRRMRDEFNIDDNRIYLIGHSMGAAGTVYLGSKYADVWAAIAPIAGGVRLIGGEILDPIRDADMPIMVIIGDMDEVVSLDDAQAFVAKLEAMGIEHEYVVLPGVSHGPVIAASQQYVYDFLAKHAK